MTPLLTGVFASQISGHLDTFTPTGSYDALATYTVPSGGVSSITFAGIPSGYSHLQIRGIGRSNRATVPTDQLYVRVNGDTGANYSLHSLDTLGNGSVGSGGSANQSIFAYSDSVTGATATAGMYGTAIIDILDYNNTSKFKTARVFGGMEINQSGGGNGYVGLYSGSWRSTAAINSITLTVIGTTFIEFSQYAIYGVK